MAKLPSRKELAARLEMLERDLAIFAAGGGAGAILARSPQARTLAAGAVSPLIVPALAADVAIRRERSIPVRAGVYTVDQLIALAEGVEMQSREMGVTPTGPVIAPTVPVTKKTPNKFSKAVGKAMRALKSSKSYGKKGVLSNAKAAFKVSTKAASARAKGRKMPKSGPSKIAYKAAKTVYTDEILRRKMK
jgi:hypothetical protein